MKEFDISLPVGQSPSEEELLRGASRALGVPPSRVAHCRIVRRSVDARHEPLYIYRVEAYITGEEYVPFRLEEYKDAHSCPSVIVIGAGPAGLFASLRLLVNGFRPVILERGKDVHARKFDMASLSTSGVINPDSNYCYGEGGAGAFSDGKLFTRSSKRGDIREVLYQFVKFGADPSILTDAHPHIGSDRLPQVVENIRRCIEEHGGEYHFSSRVVNITKAAGALKVEVENLGTGSDQARTVYTADNVILASGHSARDIYEIFDHNKWEIQAKGFAMGVRVEHPQSLVNNIRYHFRWQPQLPVADYSFVNQIDGRGVFSFCMCPGGILVPSSTEQGTVVLNGMSNAARNSRWANAGVVVSIEPGDEPERYSHDGAFALMNFQRDVERKMYQYAQSVSDRNSNFLKAPAQRMIDFCRGVVSRDLPATSYHPGVVSAPLQELLPQMVARRLQKVFPLVDRQSMRGYYTNEAILLGVESRTSSPIRIPRDEQTLQHPQVAGLYPCGEGAGYSGGIVSSAIDGIRCANVINEKRVS